MRAFLIVMIVVTSMVGMAIAILPFVSPAVAAALSPAICPANERAVLNQTPDDDGGVGINFQCLTEDGKRSDVGFMPYLVIVAIALGLPLIPTLLLIAQQRAGHSQAQQFPGMVTYSTVNYGGDGSNMVMGGIPDVPVTSIMERLDQAYRSGMLTAEQYEMSKRTIESQGSQGAGNVSYSSVTISNGDAQVSMGGIPGLPVQQILEQLDQAYQSGLITAEQYEKSKRAIQDNFGQ